MNAQSQTICLNMIVKDEAPVIRRCLASVRPFIDAWEIANTRSTDGTRDIIRSEPSGLPGKLIERPWVDFAHNRTEALDAARGFGAYLFVIDADETLAIDGGFRRPELDADSYNMEVNYNGTIYHRKQLVRSALPWRYTGVLHEYIHCAEARTEAALAGVRTIVSHEGARARDPLTYRRDALVLEKALLDEPGNGRYLFYLAQTYRDAGDPEFALRHYRRRVARGGWVEETWYALAQIALLEASLGKPWPEVIAAHLAAYQFQPDRAEPLYRIAMHYQAASEFHTAKLFFSQALCIRRPGFTRLFVDRAIYDSLLPMEYAVACFYTGDHAQAIEINERLLASGTLLPHLVDQVTRNRQFSIAALGATGSAPESIPATEKPSDSTQFLASVSSAAT